MADDGYSEPIRRLSSPAIIKTIKDQLKTRNTSNTNGELTQQQQIPSYSINNNNKQVINSNNTSFSSAASSQHKR